MNKAKMVNAPERLNQVLFRSCGNHCLAVLRSMDADF